MGLISAFLASLFSILNKKLIHETNPIEITFLEIGGALGFLTLIMPIYLYFDTGVQFMPVGLDWVYLIVLALVCTTLAYVISLKALKYISAFAANLTVNLEPVYGILLAIILLGENKELDPAFYLGVAVILGAVFAYPLLRGRFAPSKS